MSGTIIYSSSHQGTEDSTTSTNYTAIPNFPPIVISELNTRIYINLTIPETWNDTVNAATFYAITVDSDIVASGVTTMPAANARIPISLSAVIEHTPQRQKPDDCLISAVWCVTNGKCFIGARGTALLTAITTSMY